MPSESSSSSESSRSLSRRSSESSESPIPAKENTGYPDALCNKEAGLIRGRREKAGFAGFRISQSSECERDTVSDSVGLACSGGGIRSATFCLGVAQSLAKRAMLKHFDFLSTVSGGGYFGSFLSRLIQRRGSVAEAEREITNRDSWSIRWLRENGYYLAPSGTSDVWMILAQVVRNWVSVHVVLIGVFALPFLFGNAVRRSFHDSDFWRKLDAQFIPAPDSAWAWSPWLLLVALFAVLGMLVPGTLYWTTQCIRNRDLERDMQKFWTRFLGTGLMLTVFTALVALVDSVGLWIYKMILWSPNFTVGIGAVYAVAAGGFGSVQRFAGKLTELAGAQKTNLPLKRLAGIAGFVWALLFWIALATLGHLALWWGRIPQAEFLNEDTVESYWVSAGVWMAVVCGLSQVWGFVNLSSHNRFYSSRLRRAYLGAANEKRQTEEQRISENHKDDDDAWTAHTPHAFGGPLHIVNTTVNETISGKSQVEQRDRKGISLAVGPAGMSASVDYHALWAPKPQTGSEVHIAPIALGTEGTFNIFPKPAGDETTRAVESLTIGQWMGISGAAFSTGAGANTSTGLSLLLGFANVRLGYWWDSKVKPRERQDQRTPLANSQRISMAIAWCMPAPHSLVDEMLARFHGPAHQHWYLSDGGHFENTACYELIRRRVRFILCLDCGQDADMMFEDIGNLTRKARIDFGAEITFLSSDNAKVEMAAIAKRGGWVPDVNMELICCPEDFIPVKTKDNSAAKDTGKGHALMAKVTYSEPKQTSVILFLKPSLTSGLPADIQHYHRAQPDFPQQTTADQFFDEAQWESYRRLGEHIADAVIRERAEN